MGAVLPLGAVRGPWRERKGQSVVQEPMRNALPAMLLPATRAPGKWAPNTGAALSAAQVAF
ncbi:hypothetical protein SAMN05421837_106181 [Amycolatopsis pretoriensis]|uniref:Uncharacterized protein n=1 Tax=Amycolatopsis pretoriensis TaxID=218821 RepID=A0A1H5R1S2_9PSEU|nr:hypothetical protein SAMN05421837_106181 [Amycolatopsis pretoriensis]